MSRSRADCWCKHPERDVLALGSRRPRTSIQGLKRRQYREPHRSKTPEAHQSSCSHKDKSRERTQPKAPARKRHLPAANRLNRHLDSRKTARNTKPPPGPPTTEPEPNPSSPSKSLNHQTTSKHTKRRKGNRELRVRQTLSVLFRRASCLVDERLERCEETGQPAAGTGPTTARRTRLRDPYFRQFRLSAARPGACGSGIADERRRRHERDAAILASAHAAHEHMCALGKL